jgi:16S rRNA processing protein RimM
MGKKRHLIPYLPEVVVINIDEDKKIITVDWDEDF